MPITTELDIHAATDRAKVEAGYYDGKLDAALVFKANDDTDVVVGVRRKMPPEQGQAWAGFLGNIGGAVQDGKLDLTDVAKVAMGSDLGKLF